METFGNVQQKISCVFQTHVVQESSGKRPHQSYKVVASKDLRQAAIESDINNAYASEKIDGTCVYIAEFEDTPWLWARLDRKRNKQADKKFKQFQDQHRAWQLGGKEGKEPEHEWKMSDFKEVSAYWIPASEIKRNEQGDPVPDDNGHIPGWLPIDPRGRQHCWHASSVEIENHLALILQPDKEANDATLEIKAVPMASLIGCTLELIGTNINGNPYKIGSKQAPLHFLVCHGSIPFPSNPPLGYDLLQKWFKDESDGLVEGIVWHCKDGSLFKCHRHHIGNTWPVVDKTPRLCSLPVKVAVDPDLLAEDIEPTNNFALLSNLNGHKFDSINYIPLSSGC